MSMGKNDTVDMSRVTVELFVPGSSIAVASLKQAAIQQNSFGLGFDQMLATGDFSGRAQKRDFHLSVFFQRIDLRESTV